MKNLKPILITVGMVIESIYCILIFGFLSFEAFNHGSYVLLDYEYCLGLMLGISLIGTIISHYLLKRLSKVIHILSVLFVILLFSRLMYLFFTGSSFTPAIASFFLIILSPLFITVISLLFVVKSR